MRMAAGYPYVMGVALRAIGGGPTADSKGSRLEHVAWLEGQDHIPPELVFGSRQRKRLARFYGANRAVRYGEEEGRALQIGHLRLGSQRAVHVEAQAHLDLGVLGCLAATQH